MFEVMPVCIVKFKKNEQTYLNLLLLIYHLYHFQSRENNINKDRAGPKSNIICQCFHSMKIQSLDLNQSETEKTNVIVV